MAKFTYHSPGILSKIRARDGKRIFYAQVWWKGKRYTEKAGTTERQATKVLGQRQAEIDNGTFVPPREKKAADRRARAGREDLIFEAARDRFLERVEKAKDYHAAHKGYFARLGRAFAGRRLDEITRPDVLRYFEDRIHNRGAFEGWPRAVGLRPAQIEISALSALYTFLQDEEGHQLVNPCARPRSRKFSSARVETYRPKRKKVIPEPDQLEAIFRAARESTYLEARLKKPEREESRAMFGAAVEVCYYTASRPESELCGLRHGDVEIPDRGKLRTIGGEPVLGSVAFRETKTGVDRRVALHPRAEAALLGIMLDRPTRERGEAEASFGARVEAWAALPIFRSADGTAWDRHSYRKPWRAMLAAVVKDHPSLAGMVLRDLRTTANTHMGAQGFEAGIRAKLLGHSEEMNREHYVEATDELSRSAVLALGPQPRPRVAVGVAVNPVNTVSSATSQA